VRRLYPVCCAFLMKRNQTQPSDFACVAWTAVSICNKVKGNYAKSGVESGYAGGQADPRSFPCVSGLMANHEKF